MHTHAAGTAGGPCEGDEIYDLRRIWRAMTGPKGGRHRHHGPPPWAREMFGSFGDFVGGPGGPLGRGRKARRGDIRTAALLLLAEEPRNGYQIMQEVEQRSGGVWRPSPGSVYPALQQLEDEGLIRSEEAEGRRRYTLTEEGRRYVAERDSAEPAPWEQMSGEVGAGAFELGSAAREVVFAFRQLMRAGTEGQLAEAKKVLATARRDLYRILADGDAPGADRRPAEGEGEEE